MPDDRDADENEQQALPKLRAVRDARTMRALAHPVRIALIEALSLHGPLTATEAGERLGESPTTCSFHLRQLARYDFVEEAGGGKGRARPWRMSSIGMQITTDADDPEAEIASRALVGMLRERQLDRYRTWLATRSSYPKGWRDAASDSEYVAYVTLEEFEEVNEKLFHLLMGLAHERLTDPSTRPDGAVPVELLLLSYPLTLPGT